MLNPKLTNTNPFYKSVYVLVSLVIFASSTLSFAGSEGGSSTGGSGGNRKVKGWTPVNGFGGMKSTRDYSRFYELNPSLEIKCSDNISRIPALPAELANKVEISDETGSQLTQEQICKNGYLRSAYEELVISFHNLSKDSVSMNVIERILRSDSIVRVRLTKVGKKADPAWFDQNTRSIRWAIANTPQRMLNQLIGQNPTSILIHELVHVFTSLQLGGYDQSIKIWHDPRFNQLSENGLGTIVIGTPLSTGSAANNLYQNQVSPYAAFLESFSNLFELRYVAGHPMKEDISLSTFMPLKDTGWFYSPERQKLKSTPRQLLSNEPFITSTLALFVENRYIKDDEFYTGVDVRKLMSLLDAFELAAQSLKGLQITEIEARLLREVFIQYDKINKNDHGRRIVYELFNFDVNTGVADTSAYRRVTSGDETAVAVSKEFALKNFFYDAIHGKEVAEAYQKFRSHKAAKLSKNQIIDELIQRKDKIAQEVNKINARRSEMIARLEKLRVRFSSKITEKNTWNFSEKVYESIESRYSPIISISDILFALEGMRSPAQYFDKIVSELTTHQGEVQKMISELESGFNLTTADEIVKRAYEYTESDSQKPLQEWINLQRVTVALEKFR